MSSVFFDELRIPPPWRNLGVGSGPHGSQTGRMLEGLERAMVEERPDWVLIYGDTNSTLAGAVAAAKLCIPVAHVEAGLRSFRKGMPEEINRLVADRLSALLFCPTETAIKNLAAEGIDSGVFRVGDVMYDSVLFHSEAARGRAGVLREFGVEPRGYYLATVHRAENTDDPERLAGIGEAVGRMDRPVLLPLHPRTRNLHGEVLARGPANLRLIEPVPYLDMLVLERNARLILTDSGGVQKEAFWFGVPCVTLRDETEWVELVSAGCNRVVGTDPERILAAVAGFESVGAGLPADRPADLYGDGRTGEKIVRALLEAVECAG